MFVQKSDVSVGEVGLKERDGVAGNFLEFRAREAAEVVHGHNVGQPGIGEGPVEGQNVP